MFRYVALCWQACAKDQADAASRIDRRLAGNAAWRPVLRGPGLLVYVCGDEPGVNGAYPLPSRQGVILGRLFRRRDARPAASGDVVLSADEAHRIVFTDGRSLVEDFWGRYVAFLPSWTGQGRVLRDPSGLLPCYRTLVDGVCIAFSWLEDLFEVLEVPPRFSVDWEMVMAQLMLGQLGGRASALREVVPVLPGELAALHSPGPGPQLLWSAVQVARQPSGQDVHEGAAQLRQVVVSCAQHWAACYPSILLRLSGGVDSSILLSSLCEGRPHERLACLNYHSPGADSDERVYARLAALRAGVPLIEQVRDSHFDLPGVLQVARTPRPASYLGRMGSGRLDALAAAAVGARALFTGSGGDQVFLERRCTWPAADYLKLHGLGSGFVRAAMDAARLGRVSVWQSMLNAVRDRAFRGNPFDEAVGQETLLDAEARQAAVRQLPRAVHPDLLEAPDLPICKYHQVCELICPAEVYDPYLAEAAPELVTPFRSQPLVELCLAMPSFVLTAGGIGRGLARRAFADAIPAEIAQRRSKGSTHDHVTAVLRRHLDFARDLLLGGHLARQGLLDRTRLEAALSDRPSAGGTHVGEIHNCIAVECWLRRFAPGATGETTPGS